MRISMSAHAIALLAALLVCVFCPRARADGPIDMVPPRPEIIADVPKGAKNHCEGISFSYHERVEQQTLLGFIPDFLRIATPSQNARNLERAVYYNVYLAWEAEKARTRPDTYDFRKYQENTPVEIRPAHTPMHLMAFDFRLAELCKFARKKGVTRLTFACGNEVTEESHERAVDPDVLYHSKDPFKMRSGEDTSFITTECFISTYPDKGASWKDLKKHRWGPAIVETRYSDKPNDELNEDWIKQVTYVPLIRRAVSGAVVREIEPALKRPASSAALRSSLGVSHCVKQSDATPSIPGIVRF